MDATEMLIVGTAETYVPQGDALDNLPVACDGNENPRIDLTRVAPIVTTGISETFAYTFPAYSVTSLTIHSRKAVYLPLNLRGNR